MENYDKEVLDLAMEAGGSFWMQERRSSGWRRPYRG